ncbi:MAG: DeoR/GlpR transcriptional regulator [Clostridia bacterium]|nr:DeoR/GlpR transcriptional regulator [Clostridia bacterium]
MSISYRQEQILSILRERNYITVNELATVLFTSPSSIRRDLTAMQNNGLVTRSHGGVCLPVTTEGVAGFYDRMRKNTQEKRKIAQKAATLIKSGQKILLDSSSTSMFLLPHIARVKNTSIFTNNLFTASKSIELGIDTHCLGGHALAGSTTLSGAETYRAIAALRPDILFFSSQSLDVDGVISDSTEEEILVRLMMCDAAKTSVFLCDSTKFGTRSLYTLGNLSDADFAVFDEPFEELQTNCQLL